MKAPAKPKIQAPKSPAEWTKLMQAVLARAFETHSKLLPGLREALVNGQTEPFLRKLGIIHPNDLKRIFPQ
jgi:hypothetical protein